MTRVVAGIAVFALGLAFAALATATPAKDSYKLNANLKARFEVPKPRRGPGRRERSVHGHSRRAFERQGEALVAPDVLQAEWTRDRCAHPRGQSREVRRRARCAVRPVHERAAWFGKDLARSAPHRSGPVGRTSTSTRRRIRRARSGDRSSSPVRRARTTLERTRRPRLRSRRPTRRRDRRGTTAARSAGAQPIVGQANCAIASVKVPI